MTIQPDELRDVPQAMKQFIAGVRMFLRDYPGLNRLIEGEESSPRFIFFAVIDALGEFNATPPPLRGYTFDDFAAKYWTSFLMKGTVKHLLRSVALLQTRNHLRFSDGGITAQVSDKGQELMQYSQIFASEWDAWIVKIKISENIMGALSSSAGAASEYSLINGWNYGDFDF